MKTKKRIERLDWWADQGETADFKALASALGLPIDPETNSIDLPPQSPLWECPVVVEVPEHFRKYTPSEGSASISWAEIPASIVGKAVVLSKRPALQVRDGYWCWYTQDGDIVGCTDEQDKLLEAPTATGAVERMLTAYAGYVDQDPEDLRAQALLLDMV